VRSVAQLIDLYWDGDPRDRSLDQAASMASASEMAGCHFSGTQKL
jgi:hypothetical protein